MQTAQPDACFVWPLATSFGGFCGAAELGSCHLVTVYGMETLVRSWDVFNRGNFIGCFLMCLAEQWESLFIYLLGKKL